MSDVSPGARGTDPGYPVDVPTQPSYPTTTGSSVSSYSDGGDSGAKEKAKQVAGQTREAASDVKDTAKDQALRVGQEAGAQARNLAGEVRDRVGEQARTQNDKLVGTIRQTADQLDEMRGDRAEGPAAAVVSRVADSGRQFADYLESNGPEGVLREVQDFARRRPGAFLATALAAGFVVGRLGKGVAKADSGAGTDKPRNDAFSSGTGTSQYATGTTGYDTATPGYGTTGYETTTPGYETTTPGYPATTTGGYATTSEYAATGTGTPVVVEEAYVVESPERPR
jgi:hypothetical protein